MVIEEALVPESALTSISGSRSLIWEACLSRVRDVFLVQESALASGAGSRSLFIENRVTRGCETCP